MTLSDTPHYRLLGTSLQNKRVCPVAHSRRSEKYDFLDQDPPASPAPIIKSEENRKQELAAIKVRQMNTGYARGHKQPVLGKTYQRARKRTPNNFNRLGDRFSPLWIGLTF